MQKYNKLTQSQVELWLKDPVTKIYLQCLWWSQDQLKDVLGNGGTINLSSMERTFSDTVLFEGKKQGYQSALRIMDEFNRHDAIEEEAKIDTEYLETGNILKANEWNVD